MRHQQSTQADPFSVLFFVGVRDNEIARDRAAANLDTAKAQLAELESQEENTEEQIALERRIEAVLQTDSDRIERLIQDGTVAQASLDQAQRELITQQRHVLDLENQLALFPVQRISAEATIRTRTVELEEADRNLSNVVLSAPFQARVAVSAAELGDYVRVGQSVLSLNGLDAADITAEVQPDELRAALRPLLPNLDDLGASVLSDPATAYRALSLAGIQATVSTTLNGQSDRWPAEIIRIDGSVDSATGTLRIVVRVDDPQRPDTATMRPPLANGTFVEIVFTGTADEPGIALPRSTVYHDIDASFRVYLRRPRSPQLRSPGARSR